MEGPLHSVMSVMFAHAAAEGLRFRSCISFLPRVPREPARHRPGWCVLRAVAEALRLFLDIVPPFRSMPLAPPPACRLQAAGQFLRAYPACAPVPARARLAPARFAHLIARARRRTHFARPFPPGLFSAPAIASLLQKSEKAAPEAAFSLCHSTTVSFQSSPLAFFCRTTDEQSLDSTGLLETPSNPGHAWFESPAAVIGTTDSPGP